MAASMAALSRRLHLSFRPAAKSINLSVSFCSSTSSGEASDSGVASDSDITSDLTQSPESSPKDLQGAFVERTLENGLDPSVYKAIIVGQVGQSPVQKKRRSGRVVTIFSVGTGGIRNNRRPLQNEDPREYANRCAVQWHRVSVYPQHLGFMAMKNIVPGSILYLEGNIETNIFTEPVTGVVRHKREIAIRRNGRIVFLGNEGSNLPSQRELKDVGYY